MFRRKNSVLCRLISWQTAVIVLLTSVLTLAPIAFLDNSVEAEAAAMGTTRTSVHDPSIVKANGQYYIFGSHLAFAKSSDLTNWSTVNTNTNYASIFSQNATWSALGSSSYSIDGNLWAPDVIYNPTMGKWCMYMSINGDYYYSSIALATADNIEGPYTYAGTVVYSGFDNSSQASMTDFAKVTGSNSVPSRYLSNGSWNPKYGPNAIDPCVLYDANGDLWMSYGSWFGGIFMLKLNKSTGLRDYSYTYSTVTNSSDQYLGIKISGGYGCTGEGSYIVYDSAAGYYYLYMSYGGLNATDSFSNYHMRLFRSKNITGPYTDAAGNSAICTSANADQTSKGVKIMGNYSFSSLANAASGEISQKGYKSPGHNSAFVDSNGQRYVVYHTRFNQGNEWHQVRVHQQFVNQDGWLVTAPYEYLGSSISNNYSDSEIVGKYEFVNHGSTAGAMYADMLPTSVVSLNSDGTITGDYTGTWSRTSGTYYCTMNIGGVTYKGVFFKQYDESAAHTETMTFSLIGNNNQAIWGSKNNNATSSSATGTSTVGLDGIYYIKNKFSGKYLDVANGSNADGTNIQQWSYNGYDSQKFKLVSDGNGYYSILTGASGYASGLDVNSGSTADNANIEQWAYWGGDMQKFEIVEVSSGVFAIKTKCSGNKSGLDVYAWSTEDGGNVCQWNYWGGDCQLWYLEKVEIAGNSKANLDGTYYIKNKFSGKYLDVTNGSNADGTNIQQWSYNGYDSQKFKLVADGKGYYSILTGASGYASGLDVNSGSAADNANIEQWAYWGGDMQKFEVIEVNSGEYAIKTKCSGNTSCLDVYAWSAEDGGNVCQWNYWGGDCQLWYLEAASSSSTGNSTSTDSNTSTDSSTSTPVVTVGEGSSVEGLDGIYYIKNKFSNLYLDITNGSNADGTNVQQWAYNGYDSQKFKLVADGNGYYSILTGSTGYAGGLDVVAGGQDDGTNIEQWAYWGGDMQKFEIIEVNPGEYAIKTKASNNLSALEVYAWSEENGGNVCQWNYWGGDSQLWKLEKVDPDGASKTGLEGEYYIKNKFSNLYLDVENGSADDGANIQQFAFNGYHSQTFKFVPDGNGYYIILTGSTEYKGCLDVAAGSLDDGANVNQWSYLGGDCQKWEVVEVSTGVYAIKSKHTGGTKGLDVYGWSTENGGNINQWDYWGGDCQLWYLEAAN